MLVFLAIVISVRNFAQESGRVYEEVSSALADA